MTAEAYKKTQARLIYLIFDFLKERVSEVAAFLYIIDEKLNSRFMEDESFTAKSKNHACCMLSFKSQEEESKFSEAHDGQCTCTALDLCMQTNHLLDNDVREIVYEFVFKLF